MTPQLTIPQFVALLKARSGRISLGRRFALREAGDMVRDEARSALGTYRYGWPRLKPETIARKRTGDSPLLETGGLRQSIQTEIIAESEVAVVVQHPVAGFHEFGTSKMPPRPFMGPAIDRKGLQAARLIGQRVWSMIVT